MAVTNKDRILNMVFIKQEYLPVSGTIPNDFYPIRYINLYAGNVVVGSKKIGNAFSPVPPRVDFVSTGAGVINIDSPILFSGIPSGTTITHVGVTVSYQILGDEELILKTPIMNQTYNFEGTYTLENYQISM